MILIVQIARSSLSLRYVEFDINLPKGFLSVRNAGVANGFLLGIGVLGVLIPDNVDVDGDRIQSIRINVLERVIQPVDVSIPVLRLTNVASKLVPCLFLIASTL